jgi:hypothetical protein
LSDEVSRLDGRSAGTLEAIYAAALAPSLWPQALDAIAGYFDDVGAILIYSRSDGSSARSPPDVTVVRDVLGVTLGEARVAALIGSGVFDRERRRTRSALPKRRRAPH